MGQVPYHQVSDPAKLQALLDAVLVIESDLDLVSLLHQIASSAVELVGAGYGALGVLDPAGTGLLEFVHVGMDAATVNRVGRLPEGRGILGQVIVDPKPLRLANLGDHPGSVGFPDGHPPMRSFLGVPIRVRGQVYGNLYLAEKTGATEFSEEDVQLVSALASAAGIAIENVRLHARVHELSLAEERERIARDLHDTVIQRVYAVALSLQAAQSWTQDPNLRGRLDTAVEDLDETIRQVRTTIFALEPPAGSQSGLRAQILQLCADAVRTLGFEPAFRFNGPVDLVPRPVTAEVVATLREALSNIARHAHAHRVDVVATASADAFHLQVTDDGIGLSGPTRGVGRGLNNMAERAEALGGSCRLASQAEGGTRLDWRVPLS
jgi:signal transduction histidine kinase